MNCHKIIWRIVPRATLRAGATRCSALRPVIMPICPDCGEIMWQLDKERASDIADQAAQYGRGRE